MDIQYIELGPVPCDESCAQLGQENYRKQATKEMTAYINQLYRMWDDTDISVIFQMKWFNHDFGSYGEVCVIYDADCEIASDFAYQVERNLPMNWDKEALKELEEIK